MRGKKKEKEGSSLQRQISFLIYAISYIGGKSYKNNLSCIFSPLSFSFTLFLSGSGGSAGFDFLSGEKMKSVYMNECVHMCHHNHKCLISGY